MWRKSVLSIALLVALFLAALPAHAITYGTPDEEGHPNVGAIVAEWREAGKKELLCSGTLISPTVFLTAAHCTAYLESIGIREIWVTFDDEFTPGSRLIPGSMHTNPAYQARQNDPGDIAVITLDRPVRDIIPARLPTAGLFDQMAAEGRLRNQKFTAVGYGSLGATTGRGGPTFQDTTLRWTSTSSFNALNKAWLRLSQNGATGDGGTCYGDSGGPNFLGTSDVIASITVTGDAMCLATNVTYRLDTPAVRDFLDDFVSLP